MSSNSMSLNDFRDAMLKDPEVKQEYEALNRSSELELLEKLIPRGVLKDEDGVPYNNDVIWSLIEKLMVRERIEEAALVVPSLNTAKAVEYVGKRIADLQKQLEEKA